VSRAGSLLSRKLGTRRYVTVFAIGRGQFGPVFHPEGKAMSHAPPANPVVNDVWLDDGELKYFDGHDWQLYKDLTTGPDLLPQLVVRDDTEEKPEGEG
jgi:hypothetical protein